MCIRDSRQVVRRLPKEMKATGAHVYEPGDITALPFDSPEDEARHIARTCVALRGVAVSEGDGSRGISWSDMAILLRSVRRDGGTIMAALDEAGVPYVITGMDNLFQTDEAEAARQLFYFLADEADEVTLRTAWERANLGIASPALDRAVAGSAQARRDMKNVTIGQFKVYNLQRQFVAFLEACGLREETVPDGRGEVTFYNLGKFSQAISDFESIHSVSYTHLDVYKRQRPGCAGAVPSRSPAWCARASCAMARARCVQAGAMTIAPDLVAQILRLHAAEKWRVGTIARQLHVHRDTVRRVLAQSGQAVPPSPLRPSRIDAYRPFLLATLAKFPTLTAARLYAMVGERGYVGCDSHFRHLIAELRPRPPAEAYLRLRTLPGEQAQVDCCLLYTSRCV